ncbi:unnamed protein product, partial [Phaeothamnion confervicola]
RDKRKDELRKRLELVRGMRGDDDGDAFSDDDAGVSNNLEDGSELPQEQQMMRLMGFGGFDTSKGRTIDTNLKGAAKGAVSKHKKREYRQYMNRRGGFNRPLGPSG